MISFEDAIKLRDETKIRYLRDYLKVGDGETNFVAFGMAQAADYAPPELRLAIGVAFGDDGSPPGLALRTSRREGTAYRAAMKFAESAAKRGYRADVRTVSGLAVPAHSDVPPVGPQDGFPLGGDPLMLGVSIAHPKSPAGSLGGFVRFPHGGEGIISACHVLANSGRGVDVGAPDKAPMIYHPASADVPGRLTSRNQIARLQNFVTLDASTVEVDAAVAELLPNRRHIGNVIPKIRGAEEAGKPILKPPQTKAIHEFRSVAKVGRKTGYTKGKLSAGFFDEIGLQVPGQGIVYYSRLFEVESVDASTPFAEAGDSGATVFDAPTRTAFALVVGGGIWNDGGQSRMLVYCCSLAAALEALGVEWLET